MVRSVKSLQGVNYRHTVPVWLRSKHTPIRARLNHPRLTKRGMFTRTTVAATMITAIRISLMLMVMLMPTAMTTTIAAAMPTCPIPKTCKAI